VEVVKDSGDDRVISNVSGTILAANVDELKLDGTANEGTGNNLDKDLDGNDNSVTLDGAAGNDIDGGHWGHRHGSAFRCRHD
jgi:hypothetical protein